MTVGYTPKHRWVKLASGRYRCDALGYTVTKAGSVWELVRDDGSRWEYATKRDAQAHAEYRGGWK